MSNHPASDAIRIVSDPFKAVFVKRDDDGNMMSDEILYQAVKSVSTAIGLPVPKAWERVKRIRETGARNKKGSPDFSGGPASLAVNHGFRTLSRIEKKELKIFFFRKRNKTNQ